MANKKISSFYLETGLKRNWTMFDFCEDVNMSEEEFRRSLKKMFTPKAEKYYLSRLDSNEKLARKYAKSKTTSEIEELTPVVNTDVSEELSELSELEVYKAKETELRDIIFKAEIESQVLKEKKEVQTSELRRVYQKFEAILAEGEKLGREIDSIKGKLTSIQGQITQVGSKRTDAKKELDSVQAMIKQLEIITVLYTASDEIKVLGYEEDIPSNLPQLDQIIQEMMTHELLEDLTVKELRMMAKIVATVGYIENTTDREVKYQFEEPSNISAAIELLREMEMSQN